MRQAWDWDPLLQCLYLDAPLLQQQNTKKLYGTKNNCVHVLLGQIHWSKFWTQRVQRDQKLQPPLLRSLGQKQGFGEQNKRTMHSPCTDHLSHPSSPTPGHIPTLTLCEEQDCSTLGSERAISIDEEGQKPWLVTHRDFYVY